MEININFQNLIISCSVDKTLQIHDAKDYLLIKKINNSEYINCMDYFYKLKDELFIVFGDNYGNIKFYKNFYERKSIKATNNVIISIKYSNDGKYVISRDIEGKVNCWNTETYEKCNSWNEKMFYSYGNCSKDMICFYNKKKYKFLTCGKTIDGNNSLITELTIGKNNIIEFMKGIHGNNEIIAIDISYSDELLVSGGADNYLKIWKLKSKKLIFKYNHNNLVCSTKFSPNGLYVFSGCWDKSIKIFNLKTKSLLFCNKLNGIISSFAWNLNGNKYIVETLSKNELTKFEFKSKKIIKNFNTDSNIISIIFFWEN